MLGRTRTFTKEFARVFKDKGWTMLIFMLFAFAQATAVRAELVDYDVMEKNFGPDYVNAYKLEKSGKTDEALAAYDKAISQNPNEMEFYISRAGLLIALKKNGEALKDVDKYTQLVKDSTIKKKTGLLASAALMKAKALEGMGKADDAMENYKFAAENGSRSKLPRLKMADYYLSKGKKDLALKELYAAKTPDGFYDNSKEQQEVLAKIKQLEGAKKNKANSPSKKSP